jgi:hypothetical protein
LFITFNNFKKRIELKNSSFFKKSKKTLEKLTTNTSFDESKNNLLFVNDLKKLIENKSILELTDIIEN